MTEILENREEVGINDKVKLFTSQFLAAYNSGLGEIHAQLANLLVTVLFSY